MLLKIVGRDGLAICLTMNHNTDSFGVVSFDTRQTTVVFIEVLLGICGREQCIELIGNNDLWGEGFVMLETNRGLAVDFHNSTTYEVWRRKNMCHCPLISPE